MREHSTQLNLGKKELLPLQHNQNKVNTEYRKIQAKIQYRQIPVMYDKYMNGYVDIMDVLDIVVTIVDIVESILSPVCKAFVY